MINDTEIICPVCGKHLRIIRSENFSPTITTCPDCHTRIRYRVSDNKAVVSRA